jgi:hypothetical protein
MAKKKTAKTTASLRTRSRAIAREEAAKRRQKDAQSGPTTEAGVNQKLGELSQALARKAEAVKTGEPDPLQPSAKLLVMIGSAVVHADEYLSDHGDPVDRDAFNSVLHNPEVQAWIKAMGPMLPLKRNP